MNDFTNAALNAPPNYAHDAAPPPTNRNKMFFGADGLRAGWGLFIFVGLSAGAFASINTIGNHFHLLPKPGGPGAEITLTMALVGESLSFLVTLLVTWIMSKIEKRPNSVYGLGRTGVLPNFFAGLAWGVTCLSLLVLILWKTGLLVIENRLLFGAAALRYGAVWLFGFLLVGLLEEYLTRGYVLYTLTRGLASLYSGAFKTRHRKAFGFWTGAIILSILFGLGHGRNPGESPIGLVAAGLASLVFCLSLWRTGSLWWAIGFHASWDWAQSFLYGVADSGLMMQHHFLATHPLGKPLMSGGTTGPEGSIYVLPILALVSVIIIFTLPRSNYGDLKT
jgi:membrane protease YdiL (CAAX protease family)